MSVIVDGVTIYSPDMPIGVREPPDFYRDFSVAEFHAVEIYRSAAETPIEFGASAAGCGTILLWSRLGTEQVGTRVLSAGHRIGAFAGLTMSSVAGSGTNEFGEKSSRTTLMAGFFVELALKRYLAFAPELSIMRKGVRGSQPEEGSKLDLGYLAVGLPLKLQLPGATRLRPYLKAGPVLNIRISCRLQFESSGIPPTRSCSDVFFTETQDLGMAIGAGVDFGPLFLVARYDVGFNNLNRAPLADPIRNRSVSLLAGAAMSLGRR